MTCFGGKRYSLNSDLVEIVWLAISGMDRLCASTESGRLQFYVIGPSSHHSGDADSLDLDGISCKTPSVRDDSLDNVDSANQLGTPFISTCFYLQI